MYVRGDGNGSAWSHNAINAGDEFMVSASINAPVNIAGNVFFDNNGLTDNTVNGIGTNIGGTLYANLVDSNNIVVAAVPVNTNGTYQFTAVGDGNYKVVLSTTQGIQGAAAPTASLPAGYVNTGEFVGTGAGTDGTINGVTSVTVASVTVSNVNFGIYACPTITNPSASQAICIGNNGNNITVNTSSNTANGIRFVRFTSKQIAGVTATNTELAAIYAGTSITTVTAVGASSPYTATYNWNSSDFPNTTTSPITYYVYAIVNPDPGTTCRPVQEITITINPLPIVPAIIGSSTVCVNAADTLSNTTLAGIWTSSNNSIATVNNNGIVTGVSAGNVTITYTVTNINGCVNSITKLITVVSPAVIPTITASGVTTACLGGGLTLTSSVSASYQWYKDGIAISGAAAQTYTPVASGTYTMIVVAGGGACNSISNSIPVIINYAATPSITPADTAIVCVANHDKICPAVWGYSNYQWYKDGVAIAAPDGTASCLYPTAAGNYTLTAQNGAGCWSLPSTSVYVVIDTICSGTVTSGSGGGLESKSLGDIMGKRLYGDAFNSVTVVNGYGNTPQFIHNSGTVVNGANGLTLSDLIPAGTSITNKAYTTTPTDLTNVTNAIDLLSVDYTNNNNTLAVAFGTKTLGEIYSHTKPICDRMKEGQLLSVKKIKVDGYDVIASIIKQRTGEVEHCINFSIGAKAGRNSYSLQSNWITDNYAKEDTMYNFQLWAINYNTVESMTHDIFNKVKAIKSLKASATNANDLPQIFVESITREKTNIQLVINNPTNATSCSFKVATNANEDATASNKIISITLKPNAINAISIPVGDAYQSNLYMYSNGVLNDLVYMSDGTWSINYNAANATIKKFDITNAGYSNNIDEYPLFRKVNVEANSKDFITAFKLVKGNGIERNFSDYKSIKFTASAIGTGSVKITLIKKGITNWSDQYHYTLAVNNNEVDYAVALSQFVSKVNNATIDLSDITAIDFTWENTRGVMQTIGGTVNNLRFSKQNIANIIASTGEIVVYPNPNKGKFTVNFMTDANQSVVLKLVEVGSGKQIHTQFINAKKGLNAVDVNLQSTLFSSGLYIITIEGDELKYSPKKVMINR